MLAYNHSIEGEIAAPEVKKEICQWVSSDSLLRKIII